MAPARAARSPEARTTSSDQVADTSVAHPAHPVPEEADYLEHVSTIVPRALRSTRHHRVDYEFLGLPNEDFGINFYSLN